MMQIEKQREEYYKSLGTPPGVPAMKGATADPDNTGYGYNTIIGELGDHSVPEGWVQRPKFNDKGDVPGPPIQWQKPEDPDNAQPGYGYVPTDTTNTEDIFFYHSDHLGSTSYITDAKANITQFDAYLPYGELLVDEHSSSEEMPYKFNGKEFDQETGLYYYGARYMNPRTSLWYGVDPLAEKYPNISPYAYAFFNPIKFIDPNGESSEEGGWIGTTKSNKKTSWEWDPEVDTESQARAKYGNVEFYKGGNKVFHESGTNKPFHLKGNGTWEYFSERNSANVSLPIILGESIVSDIALSTLLKFTGTLGMVLSLQGDSPGPNYKYFYRAMSASEYAKTNGYLMDTRPTGEGPHVRRDIQYLLNAKFINNSGKYDYIVQYMVKKEAAELFESTPFVFTPGQGKGGEIFNNARKVGLPYMKYEKGDFSYGFPGSKATTLFNSSLIGKPKIIHKIGTKQSKNIMERFEQLFMDYYNGVTAILDGERPEGFLSKMPFMYEELLEEAIMEYDKITDTERWLKQELTSLTDSNITIFRSKNIVFNQYYIHTLWRFDLICDYLNRKNINNLNVGEQLNATLDFYAAKNQLERIMRIIAELLSFIRKDETSELIYKKIINSYYKLQIEDKTILLELEAYKNSYSS